MISLWPGCFYQKMSWEANLQNNNLQTYTINLNQPSESRATFPHSGVCLLTINQPLEE